MANFTGLPVGMPVDSTARSASAELPLGTKAYDSLGNEYTYVKATAAISAKEAVKFTGSALGYDDVVKTTAAANEFVVGVATAAFATTAPYGFIQTGGVVTALVKNSEAAGSMLGTGTTAVGTLELHTTSTLAGARSIVSLTSATNSASVGAVVYLG